MFHFRILSCSDLPIKDANGLIDSYVVIETKGKDQKPRPGGKTKVVKNNLNPTYPDQVFDIPSDDCYTIKFTVMDQDPFRDDMACWIKIKVPSLFARLGEKITKEMVVINPEHHPNCHPMITFMVELEGNLAEDYPEQAPPPPPEPAKPKVEPVTFEQVNDGNKYFFNILILKPDEKKYWFSENQNLPAFVKKDGDKYTVDAEGQGNLIVVPVIRTQTAFKKANLQVKANDVTLQQELKYRGEWLMNQALLLPTKEVKKFKPVHRNNWETNKWIASLPEELAPKGDYQEF